MRARTRPQEAANAEPRGRPRDLPDAASGQVGYIEDAPVRGDANVLGDREPPRQSQRGDDAPADDVDLEQLAGEFAASDGKAAAS